MKKLPLIILSLFCSSAFACECARVGLIDRFERADFVATAEIQKITPAGSDYHNIEIKVGEVFKGSSVNKLKIESILNSSCSFYTPEKSNWLIFAYKDSKLGLVFGSCSGSIQLDRKVNEEKYPEFNKKTEQSNQKKLSVLRFIKETEIDIKNDFRLNYTFLNNCLDKGKGFALEEGTFGLFKIWVSKELKVKAVTTIKGLGNESLNSIINQCFKDNFELYYKDKSKISKATEITVGIYFYGVEGEHQSFVTIFDL
ncbi:hypothetical protein [Sediminicola arcticus]|jgi:hypothetical protein|uniref:Tissue inhibitor of metalloproteinase n=1 Tax=Sediminicola arcticus TaxID=1574308 RepID=A0ABV2SU71_9FLAO